MLIELTRHTWDVPKDQGTPEHWWFPLPYERRVPPDHPISEKAS